MEKNLIEILKKVEKPARYMGGEALVRPVGTQMRVKFCLCCPTLYEMGMKRRDANILYYLLNDRKGYSAERCYAPQVDMARELLKEGVKLFSLENKLPLSQFDLLAFSLEEELDYFNIAYMLTLAKIPAEAVKRTSDFPLIFAYGKLAFNPEPLANIFDFFIIGDYEDMAVKVVDTIMKAKLSNLNKQEILTKLAQIEGIYVPSLIEVVKDKKGIVKIKGSVKSQVIRDLDRAFFPTKLMISNIGSESESAFIEPVRGCGAGCRFCQEGYVSRPVRERRVQTLVSQATSQIVNSGFDRLRIALPSAEAFPRLKNLLTLLEPICSSKGVEVEVENVGCDNELNSKILKQEDELVLSLEAGSERLRKIINKPLSKGEILSRIEKAFNEGTNKIRLFFMVGLPYETAEDLMEIIELALAIKQLYKSKHQDENKLQIVVQTSVFIPKAFTPFQWSAFIGIKEAEKRLGFIAKGLSQIGVKNESCNPTESAVSAIMLRGDREVSKCIIEGAKRGVLNLGNFDANLFFDVAKDCGIDSSKYFAKKDIKDVLAWDFIDVGVGKQFFIKELVRAQKDETTDKCANSCSNCGLHARGLCKYGNC